MVGEAKAEAPGAARDHGHLAAEGRGGGFSDGAELAVCAEDQPLARRSEKGRRADLEVSDHLVELRALRLVGVDGMRCPRGHRQLLTRLDPRRLGWRRRRVHAVESPRRPFEHLQWHVVGELKLRARIPYLASVVVVTYLDSTAFDNKEFVGVVHVGLEALARSVVEDAALLPVDLAVALRESV